MAWTENEMQAYRETICYKETSSQCDSCTRTKEDISECYADLKYEMSDDGGFEASW